MLRNCRLLVYTSLFLALFGAQLLPGTAEGAGMYLDFESAIAWLDEDLRDTITQRTDPAASSARQLLQQVAQGDAAGAGGVGGEAATTAASGGAGAGSLSRRELEKRCRGTVGRWCGGMEAQLPTPFKPPPRGNRTCPRDCSGVGNCNHDTGTCDCPAGSQGEDCGTVLLRPCTTHFGDGDVPVGHIDAEGRDLGLTDAGYTESRCTGICDPVTARCFCDGNFRRVNPPPGSPPGTPAPVRGRPLGNHQCQVSDDGQGNKLEWGQVPWQQVYGPDGWCNSDKPVIKCGCLFDGFAGELCDEVTETMCPNQCSGHGECDTGFCKCHPGWYGTDCARKVAGEPVDPGLLESGARPWLANTVRVPPAAIASYQIPDAATQAALRRGQRRPLIYVYDLPSAYNARMLQYRNDKGVCTWRAFESGNRSETFSWTYGLEVLMHEMMLQSEHRTFDPEAADFFYVPVYTSCFIFPIHCYADGPWWYAPSGPRVMHVTNMMLEVRDWIRKHFPYWDRRGGRDHIWLMTHDEGACYAPTEIYNASIFLTHWGRTDLDHASNTAYTPDNYTQEYEHLRQPGGWLRLIRGHPCHTPGKDLVIPALKLPRHFEASPLLFRPPRQRDILLYLRGDVGKHRLAHYSRGIRQRLYQLWKEQNWREKYNVLIGDGGDVPGSYSDHLSRSKFCIVAPGDGWSPRVEDAVLHGCIPVIIMDGVQAVWEDQLQLGALSVRVRESELEGLPARLEAVPGRQVEAMQQQMRTVWHRYAYASHPLLSAELQTLISHNVGLWRLQVLSDAGTGQRGPETAERMVAQLQERAAFPAADDAFHTILQWLHAKIPGTR